MDRVRVKLMITVFVGLLLIRLSDECGDQNNTLENSLTTEELKALRDEIIKREILQKLGLSERPIVSQNLTFPNALIIKDTLGEITETNEDDDYYARTQNIVLLPSQIGTSSVLLTTITFEIDPTKFPQGMPSAHLWLYMHEQNESTLTYILYLYGIESNSDDIEQQIVHVDHVTRSSLPDWRKYEVTRVLRDRLRRNSNVTFAIDCYGCNNDSIGTMKEVRPFIVIGIDPSHRSQRNKRHIECSTNSSHCCRENYDVSFVDIGWDDWIAFPKSYGANFCRGDCHFDPSLARYHHTTVMQDVMQAQLQNQANGNVRICCSPSKMSSLSILYYINNDTMLTTLMPNMVVEACDCA